ncbi:MAG: SsrA-binding protein SmpB [Bacteroidota bacterium]|nr:SsrA-binding protein SmpB [Bacteroidota bacterium]
MNEVSITSNKKALFEYHIESKLEAGIVLTGTEIKSVRQSQTNLSDSFCIFINEELFVRGMHIAEYREASYNNHASKRDRKLLLSRKELNKLRVKTKEKGFTIIPTRLYISDRGFAKLEIALARGKKMFDKREDLKKKDATLEMSRVKKDYRND